MTFSEKLIALRARDRLTQTALARAVGVTRQSVYMWEKGQSYPEAETLLALRRLFGVSVDALLDDAVSLSDLPAAPRQEARAIPYQPEKKAKDQPETDGEKETKKERFSEEKAKTPAKAVEEEDVPFTAEEAEQGPREPLRAKVEPTRERKSGSILDLIGAFWKKKK